jgi:hypothetical protein
VVITGLNAAIFIQCGKGGIRTLGTREGTHAFQACQLSHSCTFPKWHANIGKQVFLSKKFLSTFLLEEKWQKKLWLQIICYKFSSIPLFGKQLTMFKQLLSLPFHSAEFILRKLFEAVCSRCLFQKAN